MSENKQVRRTPSRPLKVVITTRYNGFNLLLVRYLKSLLKGEAISIVWQEPTHQSIQQTSVLRKFRTLVNTIFIGRKASNTGTHQELQLLLKGKIPIFSFHAFSDRFVNDPNSKETLCLLRRLNPDVILVIGGKILNKPWVEAAKFGSIGFHPGILPNYRGACPVEFALYYNEFEQIGGTLFCLNEGIDAGAILKKFYVNPRQYQTIEGLISNIFKVGIETLSEVVKIISKNRRKIKPEEMNQGGRLFFRQQFTPEVHRTILERFQKMKDEKYDNKSSLNFI